MKFICCGVAFIVDTAMALEELETAQHVRHTFQWNVERAILAVANWLVWLQSSSRSKHEAKNKRTKREDTRLGALHV